MQNMARAISQSTDSAARSSQQSFNQMSTGVGNAARSMADSSNNAYRSMGTTAQQTYSQMNGYGQSAYRQQQEAARLAYNSMSTESRRMHAEMREAWRAQSMAMGPMRDQMMSAQYDYFKLTQASKTYQGTTAQFLAQVKQVGAAQKAAADAALKANELAKMSMIQQAGTMMNMSTQAEKITANYERMNNPLLRINAGGLAIANTFNKMALAGDASVLALKMLGPTANMKALTDMQNMIMQGQMRIGMVAMASAATCAIAYKALWEAAKGPDPKAVFAEQEAALNKYKEAVVSRTNEIVNAWSIFEKVTLNKTSPKTLMKNLQDQVTTLGQWKDNLTSIASRTSQEFANYLAQLGPTAAAEVAAVNKMSQPELDKYVALWKEKTALARGQAVTELEGLKAETMAKIKELQDSLTPLGLAFEKFKTVWAEALKPMVQAFSNLVTPIVEVGTKIGELVIKFNEAHPTMALVIQGAMMLVPALTLLLSPLAAGIGLWNGILAAMNGAWMIIGPLVTGLGAMTATVWVVAGALAALAAGFVYLWNNSETFKNGVIAGWEAIKAAAIAVWNFLLTEAIQPAMEAITSFVNEKLAMLKQFWTENGAQITQAATNAWNGIVQACQAAMAFLGPIFDIAWMIIKEIVIGTWEAIKNVINGALNIILGLVKVFSGIFTGDWTAVWEGIKQIWNGALELIWGWFQLWGAGRILGFLGKFVGKFKQFFVDMWNAVKTKWDNVITEIWFFFAQKFEAGKALGTSIMNAIKSMFQSVWNAIKSVWNTVIDAIKSFFEARFNAIKSAASTIMNAIKNVFQTVWNAIKSVVETVINAVKSVIDSGLNAAKSVVNSVLNAMKTVFSTVWNAIKTVVQNAINAVKSVIDSGMNAAKNIVSTVGNAIKTAFTNIWNGFKDIVSKTFDSVKSAVTGGLEKAKDVITNFGKTFYDAGKGLITMMADGIKNAASAVTDAIGDIASKARDFLPFSPAKTGPLSDIDKLDFGGPISDSIHRATKGIQVNLASMLELPVIGATGGGMTKSVAQSTINNNNGGNTNVFTVQIDPRNMEELEHIVEFFDTFKQKKRARG